MPKDLQHVQFLNNYYNGLEDPNILTQPTQEIADNCNQAHVPPTTQGIDGVDSQIVGRHMSECRKRAANQARAERNSPEQTQILEAAYALNHYPPPGQRMILMWQTGLSYRKIKNWYEQKAKMLKRTSGRPQGNNSRSNKYATRMWKAYDADREGYVQKLLDGSICPVTGADLTQRMRNNLPPTNGAMNNMNGYLGFGLMVPGANIISGPNNQNGLGSFQAMQAPSHNQMNQHGQVGFQHMPAPQHNQMNHHGQNGFQGMQAPLPNQVNQQAQHGSQQMPMYTQAQSQMYSMPPAQFMNVGNSGLTAGQSYPANGSQQASQQVAQPGANILNPAMRNAPLTLLSETNKAVSDHQNGGMAGWSSIPSGRPAAQNYQTSRQSQGQGQWKEQHVPPYPQVPASRTEQPPNGRLAQPGKRKFTPAEGEMDNTEHPKKQHKSKSMRRVSRTRGQMKPEPSPEFLDQLTNIAEGVYQGHTFMAPNTGMSFNNGGMNRWSPNQSPTKRNGYGRHYDGETAEARETTEVKEAVGARKIIGAREIVKVKEIIGVREIVGAREIAKARERAKARETTPAISTPINPTPDIDPGLLDPRLFDDIYNHLDNDNGSTSEEPRVTANQDPHTFDPQQHFTQEAQEKDNPTVQGRAQSFAAHNARSQGGIWEAGSLARCPPPLENSPYQQDGAQELESQGQVLSPLEYLVNAQDVDNFDDSLLPADRYACLDSIPMNGRFDFDSFLGNLRNWAGKNYNFEPGQL
ncbi:hypothetical protein EAF04_005452 [Stromatinia cepivora]|nr:hypothetical protein EAF04_005452 [Stromatinia cepivora]